MTRKTMFGWVASVAVLGLALSSGTARAAEDEALGVGPAPSPTPISWEFEFQFLDPRRIEAQINGKTEVFWYMVYTVVNTSGRTQRFFPTFQLVTEELKVLDTDTGIPAVVFDSIAERHRLTHPRLVHPTKAIGDLRAGNDYALESVAIWRQGDVKVNNFTIYVAGLSGETRFVGSRRGAHTKDAKAAGGKGSTDADAPKAETAKADGSADKDGQAAGRPDEKGDNATSNEKKADGAATGETKTGVAAVGGEKKPGERREFVLRKTLELKYLVAGSADARLVAEPVRKSVRWVMR